MIDLIEEKFPAPAWAVFSEVANGTGFSRRRNRHADALAMSLWPSRGLELHGFEVKEHRSDWLRELRDPQKAEDMARFCDRWWLVAAPNIVERAELPPKWGLLERTAKGRKKLVQKVAADKLEREEWDRAFVAAILRRANEQQTAKLAAYVSKESIADQLAEAEERGFKRCEYQAGRAVVELRELRELVGKFEEASGLKLTKWCPSTGDLGAAVKVVMDLRQKQVGAQGIAERMVVQLDRTRAALTDYIELAVEEGVE